MGQVRWAGWTMAIATAFVTLAVAQPKKGGAPAPKKPPPPKVVEAGADNPYDNAPAAPTLDAGLPS